MGEEVDLLSKPLMTPLASQDPFYVVKEELIKKLESIAGKVDRFQNLLWNSNTAGSADFKEARKQLSREVKAAEGQLKDLEMTVDLVERDRSAFAHIDDREFEDRKSFVQDAKLQTKQFRDVVSGPETRQKIDSDEKEHLAATRGNYGASSDIEMVMSSVLFFLFFFY